MDNTKKAILVSGASSGIGKQCAMRLDKAGFKVFAGLRSKKEAKELTQIASDRLKPLMLDITDSQSIDSAVHIVSSENLYGLVNNAGIAVLYDDLDQRAGAKFASMDLIGLPWQVIVGPRGVENDEVEIKRRATGARDTVSFDGVVSRLTAG